MLPIPMFSFVNGPTPSPPAPTPFKMTIATDPSYTGSSGTKQFKVPLQSGYNYNCVINWGDGSTSSQIGSSSPTHTYASSGTYQVSITGIFESIYFAGSGVVGEAGKILSIDAWGNQPWKTMNSAFKGCLNMVGNYTDAPNLSLCSSTNAMFNNADLFNGTVSNWNTSNVTNMDYMFAGGDVFNGDVSSWDVSSVTSMSFMFDECGVFNGDVSSWDVSNVINMSFMFSQCSVFNRSLNNWDVSSVTDIQSMMALCVSFNQPLNNWDVSSVTSAFGFMTGKTAANYNASYLDDIYNSWSLLTLHSGVNISFAGIKYTASGVAGRAILTSAPNSWSITDGGI